MFRIAGYEDFRGNHVVSSEFGMAPIEMLQKC
jgi:hypothetical protein